MWTLGFGGTFDVAEGLFVDIGYSYRHYGKSKTINFTNSVGDVVLIKGNHFRSHNITVGVRYSI